MATNFLVLYFSKEGSSAVISSLSAQKDIRIPLFEALDFYIFSKGNFKKNISDTMREVFRTGVYPDALYPAHILSQHPKDEPFKSVGFKWRFWDNASELIKTAKELNITVFFLSRRDLIEQSCSHYIEIFGENRKQSGEFIPHPQFALSFGTDEDKETLRHALQQQNFDFDETDFRRSVFVRLTAKKQHLDLAKKLAKNSINIKHIYYEDFCTDRDRFIRNFLSAIDLPAPVKVDPFCWFTKVKNQAHSRQLMGFDHITGADPMKSYLENATKNYQDMLDQIDRLCVRNYRHL